MGIAKIQHDLRESVNAILYVNRTGIAWEYLPHDFPPYKTVHGYFALWEKEGVSEAIRDALRGKVRAAAGRAPEPTAVILDAQTVKTSGKVPEHSQGIDAGNYQGSSVMPGRAHPSWCGVGRPGITTGSPGRPGCCPSFGVSMWASSALRASTSAKSSSPCLSRRASSAQVKVIGSSGMGTRSLSAAVDL